MEGLSYLKKKEQFCTSKTAENKIVQGEPRGKKSNKRFILSLFSFFDVDKYFLHKLLPTKKQIM